MVGSIASHTCLPCTNAGTPESPLYAACFPAFVHADAWLDDPVQRAVTRDIVLYCAVHP